jgi:hypothetical protein
MAAKKKKSAIEGKPKGIIDDIIEAISKSVRKPSEVTVNVGRKSSSVKKVTARKLVAGENGRPPVRGGRVKIDSKPKVYNETYTKGTKEYRDAIKTKRRDESALKKVNKYSNARATRNMEYNEARSAQGKMAYTRSDSPAAKAMYEKYATPKNKKVVDDFVNMSPRRVKSGKRPAVKQPKPDKSITRKGSKK